MPVLQSTAIRVAATGTQVVTSGTSQRVAIPVAADGNKPRYLRVAATGAAYLQPGDGTVTATTSSMLITGQGETLILAVKGFSHIALLQETAGAKVSLTPLED